jgi:hypothetical protein
VVTGWFYQNLVWGPGELRSAEREDFSRRICVAHALTSLPSRRPADGVYVHRGDSSTSMLEPAHYGVDPHHLRRKERTMELFMLAAKTCGGGVSTILWIIAAIFVIGGIVTLLRGAVLYGIVLIVVGLLIGPGGVSIFC